MPISAPIQLNLYDADDQVIATHGRARIPIAFVERAIEIAEGLDEEASYSDALSALYQLTVDFFGDKFTVEELKAGADFGEMYAVLQAIIARVSEIMPAGANPTRPGKARRRTAAKAPSSS